MDPRRIIAVGVFLSGVINTMGNDLESRQTAAGSAWPGSYGDWIIVNDGVMGGMSQSRVIKARDTSIRFCGTVSLENNGGFASIRHDAHSFGIGPGEGIRLRLKGDGKTYQLRVRTSNRFDGIAYKAELRTVADEWQEFRIPWEHFKATYRGRDVKGAPELRGAQIRQIGFLIADKQEGSFQLEVESIGPFGP